MRIIARIARTELATLFFSPIAWFILIVFSYLSASDLMSPLSSVIRTISTEGAPGSSLTSYIYVGTMAWYSKLLNNLYIYVPLLTMGLMSRETSTESIKLLYSSPVRSSQIVIGKYLAAVVFGLAMMIIPITGTICGGILIPHFDWPATLVALLGVYLLICTYSAIGLFISSLTNYQVVAAVGTLAILAVLRFVGSIGQEYDFVRDLTYWLSIDGRTSDLLCGALRSEDVIYFIVVIALFLGFSILRLVFRRKALNRWIRLSAYLGLFVVALLLGYVTSRPAMVKVWDMTANKSNSISEQSKQILAQIEGEVTVTNYVNLLDNKSFSYLPIKLSQNKHIFDAFRRFKPDFNERSVYYYAKTPVGLSTQPRFKDKSAEDIRDYMAMVYNLNPRLYKPLDEISKTVDLSGEDYQFVRVVRLANGKESYLRDFNDMFTIPLEREISAVLRKLSGKTPVVAFITGHGEREITRPGDLDYSNFAISKYSRSALMNQGFDVVQLDLQQSAVIPEHINILVIADMRTPMSQADMKAISDYIERGGNLFIFADVNRQKSMSPLLAKFGVQMLDNQLVQPFSDFYPDLILSRATQEAASLFDGFDMAFRGRRVSMPGCVALAPLNTENDFTLTPILTTREKGAWIEIDQKNVREEKVVCNPQAGEVEQRYVTAYAAERKLGDKTQRILICGDADCVSNVELSIGRNGYRSANFQWVVQGFRYLTNGEFPIEIPEIPNKDITINADVDDIPIIKFIFTILIPACMLLLGVGFWYFRRRK